MTYAIHTDNEDRPIAGVDSFILEAPDRFYFEHEGRQAVDVLVVVAVLRGLSERQATALDERLHHADWVLTADPSVVESRGVLHDCEECRAGVQRALRFLRENPGREVAVGTLYWAEP